MAHVCHHCGAAWEGDPKIGRGASCHGCGSPIHCCLNCRFHDAAKDNECNEPAAEWVRDKRGANFCLFFEWAEEGGAHAAAREAERKKRIDDQIKDLFKD